MGRFDIAVIAVRNPDDTVSVGITGSDPAYDVVVDGAYVAELFVEGLAARIRARRCVICDKSVNRSMATIYCRNCREAPPIREWHEHQWKPKANKEASN